MSREHREEHGHILWEQTGRSGRRHSYNRKTAHAKYLRVAKQRKPRFRQVQKAIKEQLSYAEQNPEMLDGIGQEAFSVLSAKHLDRLLTIRKVYEQQTYMMANKTHTVENRVVSL